MEANRATIKTRLAKAEAEAEKKQKPKIPFNYWRMFHGLDLPPEKAAEIAQLEAERWKELGFSEPPPYDDDGFRFDFAALIGGDHPKAAAAGDPEAGGEEG